MGRTIARAALAAAMLATAACGGKAPPGGPQGEGDWLRVTVENDGTIPGQVRIYLMPGAGGMEHHLGALSTLGTGTVEATLPEINGSYRLRAESGGSVLLSPFVALRGNEHITWDMRRNTVRVNR